MYFAALLISLHALLFYGLPLAGILFAWLLLAVWFMFAGGAQALLTAVPVAIFTLLLNISIQLSGLERSMYYRPHELLKSSSPDFGDVYQPNTRFSMHMPFGDIEAMEKVGIQEPREIEYQTDALGFRNPTNYHGQKFVLVGDSFVAGLADTQSCITTEWLRREHHIDTYNLGYPGDMDDYVNRVRAFRSRYGKNFHVLLFVFEGNDFIPYSAKPPRSSSLLQRYYSWFKNSAIWRYTRALYLRGTQRHAGKNENASLVRDVGHHPIAFYSQDLVAVANRQALLDSQLRFTQALQALQPNLAQIFFVPSKYRVYARWLDPKPLPNEQWLYLERTAKQTGIPVHNLTPALEKEAERLLPQGQYVYWRDDTHWNCNGMRTAATEVAHVLSQD